MSTDEDLAVTNVDEETKQFPDGEERVTRMLVTVSHPDGTERIVEFLVDNGNVERRHSRTEASDAKPPEVAAVEDVNALPTVYEIAEREAKQRAQRDWD